MNVKFRKITAMLLCAAILFSSAAALSLTAAAASPEEHITLSRQASADGQVLLVNRNNVLPLDIGANVAIFGRAMIDYTRGGGGSGATNVDYQRNLLQGLKLKEEEHKIRLEASMVDFYTEQVAVNGIRNDADIPLTTEMIGNAAGKADTAIVAIGRTSAEGSDLTESDFRLTRAEKRLLMNVENAFENTIVILNTGSVMDTSWIDEIPGIDAVLVAWQGGMEGGLATADVLVGDVNPSGKLTDTWAKSYADYPGSSTFNQASDYVDYTEDIYVGYRYFETIPGAAERVSYEFGFGLSYTTFEIKAAAAAEGANMVVTADVTNTGEVAGKEVVQVYFDAPRGELGKPARELAAFAKTKLLQPGETQQLTLSFPIDDMSSYDDTGVIRKSAWVMEQGTYEIYVGNSIRKCEKAGSYTLDADRVVEQLTEQCAPIQLPRRMNEDGTYSEMEMSIPFDPHHTIAAQGTNRVEMESYIASSGEVVIESWLENDLSRNHCLARLDAAGEAVEYELTVEKAGAYDLVLSFANGYSMIPNCVSIYVNDVLVPGIRFDAHQTGDGNGAGEWYNFVETDPMTINLEEGKNTLRVTANGLCPNFDYMLLTYAGDPIRYFDTEVPAAGAVLEAESFKVTGMTTSMNIPRMETFFKDDREQACLAYMNYEGNYVSYYLHVEQAGTYDLVLKTANGRDGFDFDPGIMINGQAYPATLTAVQTGDGNGAGEWYNFEDLQPVTVSLPDGECILTLTSSGDYPNVDTITLTPVQSASRRMLRSAAADSERLTLLDVYNDASRMPQFLDQLSDSQLIDLLGGQPNTGLANTGGIGNLVAYNVPNVMTADGSQGLRIGENCTAWPIATSMASTWDVELMEAVGKATAAEAEAAEIDIWLAPGMNIHRNPLCGRNFEYFSEDPLLTGVMAAHLTKGAQEGGLGVTLKHFCVNNREHNRNSSDSRVTERALREIYLKGFEIAVKQAEPWAVMSSYNLLNGMETSENKELLTGILRNEWGFDGLTMTDWGNNSNNALEVLAGNDVKMPSGAPATLRAALNNGALTRDDLEASAQRVLELVMKTNTFRNKLVNTPAVEIGEDTTFKAAENIIWSQIVKPEATSDSDGGNNLGYCDRGAWAEYAIEVLADGKYDLSARASSNAGAGAFRVLVDGEIAAEFDVPMTGGWQSWTTLNPQEIILRKGRHTLRLEWTESGSNLNWLRFEMTELLRDAEADAAAEAAAADAAAAQTAAEEAKTAADAAQAAADAAAASTASDKTAAEAAQAAAEEAKTQAEAAQTAADTAKANADAAQAAADAIQVDAAKEASQAAADAKTAAETARDAAEAAQAAAEAAKAQQDAQQKAEEYYASIVNSQVAITVTGAVEADVLDETAAFTVSADGCVETALFALTMEADPALVTDLRAAAADGLMIISQAYENGRLIVVVGSVDGLNGSADLLTITGQLAGGGQATLQVTDARITAYLPEDQETYVAADLTNAAWTVTIHFNVYDINRDGVVNLLDVTRAQRFYGEAYDRGDVNGDGMVTIEDLILIILHFTE